MVTDYFRDLWICKTRVLRYNCSLVMLTVEYEGCAEISYFHYKKQSQRLSVYE